MAFIERECAVSYFSDLWLALKGDFIALDETEAALIGAPPGETLSLYAAFEAKHGVFWAHVACLVLFAVQAHHCRDQLLGIPMATWNYLRAAILLLIAPLAVLCLTMLTVNLIWRLL